ncbi:MAG TPA: hypothetical protein VIV11_38870 [Kofleriaceae bacterium]
MKAAMLLVALAACAATPLDEIEIACTSDAECPDETWCDLRYHSNVCRSLEHSGPPRVVFDGFVVGDQLAQTISVPSKTISLRDMRLRNAGGSQTYVTMELIGPPCVDADSNVRNDGELVDEGDSFDAGFSVYPVAGCASPAMLTVTATASSRVFTFTAMISITP